MCKFIGDRANFKLTDFEQPFFGQLGTTTDTALNGNRTKKIKKKPPRKKFYANAHCTHLPLPANTQCHPKAKPKECNRQRFIPLRSKLSLLFTYICPVKFLTLFLALYVLTLSTVPYYVEDKCLSQDTQTEQSGHDEQGCSDCCSPFVSCGTCCGFAFNLTTFSLQPAFHSTEKIFSHYKQTIHSQFAPSIWQPPKIS